MANRRTRVGRVIRDKMEKTVIVAVERRTTHPVYRKTVKRLTKFAAHAESGVCSVGDLVRIEETRPLSRSKRWRVIEVLERKAIPVAATVEAAVQEAVAPPTQAPAVAQETPAAEVAPGEVAEAEAPVVEASLDGR